MSITLNKIVIKKTGIGANSEWKLVAADAESIKLKLVNEPTIFWTGSHEQYAETFVV